MKELMIIKIKIKNILELNKKIKIENHFMIKKVKGGILAKLNIKNNIIYCIKCFLNVFEYLK